MPSVDFQPIIKERAAEILSVSKRTIENWIAAGEMPAPVEIGRRVYWHPDTFYGWLNQKLVVPAPPDEPLSNSDSDSTSPGPSTKRVPVRLSLIPTELTGECSDRQIFKLERVEIRRPTTFLTSQACAVVGSNVLRVITTHRPCQNRLGTGHSG